MIYRAHDCGIEDRQEPLTCVWFESSSKADAGSRLTTLLSLVWEVDAERIFFGNLNDVISIEHDSLQDNAVGERRWLEGGSTGGRPLYFAMPMLVMLTARNRRRLAKAAKAARNHAKELIAALVAESALLVPDSREATNLNYDIRQYRDFADQIWLSEPGED